MINPDTQVNETLEWPTVHYDLLAIGEGHLHPALETDPSNFDAVRPWTPRQYFRELYTAVDADLERHPMRTQDLDGSDAPG